jgi:hypothetical protein
MVRAWLLSGATLAGSGCSVVIVESAYIDQAEDALATYYAQNLEGRWIRSPITDYARLSRGGSQEFEVNLAAGQVAGVLGSCDKDCVDLNIEVFDASGRRLAFDADSGSTEQKYALAQFSSEESASYRVEIGLADCITDDCFVAWWVVLDRSGTEAVSELDMFYNDELSARWEPLSIIQSSDLPAGEGYAIQQALDAGQTFGVIAACDAACTNLEVQVFRASDGRRVAFNQEETRLPFVEFETAELADYRIEIGMTECTNEPCSFAYMVIRQRQVGESN